MCFVHHLQFSDGAVSERGILGGVVRWMISSTYICCIWWEYFVGVAVEGLCLADRWSRR